MSKFVKTPLLLLFALALQTQAIQFISTNTYAVATDETVDDELWIQATDTEVNGLVNDDLFLLVGNQMTLGGDFKHNLWGLGNQILLTGSAKRNVRLMGKTIQLKGSVEGNILMIGKTIKIAPTATIGGDIHMLGNSIILEGATQNDVSITATRVVTISGTIGGNLDIIAPEIILQRDAHIGGHLTYTASKELVPAAGMVSGKLTRTIPQRASSFSKARLLAQIMWFFAALIAGIPFVVLFPMTTAMATQFVRTAPWKCLWVGVLCALALPVFGLMSASSGIGLPLGALILGGWGFMAYTSRIIMGLVIGTLILRKKNTSIGHVLRSMALGLAVIYIGTAIPSISLSVHITIVSMGMGALLLSLFQKRRLLIQLPQEHPHPDEQEHQPTNKN